QARAARTRCAGRRRVSNAGPLPVLATPELLLRTRDVVVVLRVRRGSKRPMGEPMAGRAGAPDGTVSGLDLADGAAGCREISGLPRLSTDDVATRPDPPGVVAARSVTPWLADHSLRWPEVASDRRCDGRPVSSRVRDRWSTRLRRHRRPGA